MASDQFAPTPLARPGAALAARVPYWFERIGLALTLVDARGWHALHTQQNTLDFESEYGLEPERWAYNGRMTRAAAARGRAIVGEHAGFFDVFAPVIEAGVVRQLLIAGPLLVERPSASRLVEQWGKLTNRYARPSDPSFSRYASITLGTLVLDSEKLELFQRYLTDLTTLLSGVDPEPALVSELEQATDTLARARFADRMWAAVETMVHPAMARLWASPGRADQRAEMGLAGPPQHALVALFAARDIERDPVEEMVQRDGCQRAFVELCRRRGQMASGRLGDYGASLLLPSERSAARVRTRFVEVARTLRSIARDFGLSLFVGTSSEREKGALPDAFRAAFAAANHALSEGIGLAQAPAAPSGVSDPLFEIRRSLAEVDSRRPFE
ncbi:MAG TPA: hypothetical protein VGP93_08675, partial [Polyangiaceae bacterium]|nr:hypothetical protein [Polyangiaceae bacterium]